MVLPKEVTITEVCPRDGFQSIKETIPLDEKVSVIHKLMSCGFKQIEVTSFVHPKAIPQLKDADQVLKDINRRGDVKLRALVPNLRGLERAITAGVDKVKLMLSASDSHSLSNANRRSLEAMEPFEEMVERVKDTKVQISGSISVAFGCPYEGEVSLNRLLSLCKKYDEIGIHDVSLADTTGMANPVQVKKIVSTLRNAYPDFRFSLHLHNTRGMAFANAVAGLEEGIIDFDSSVAGLGGCPYAPNASGNIASEDLIHGFHEMGIHTGIDLDQLIVIGQKLMRDYPKYADSFVLKAGKVSDLHIAPNGQKKLS